MSIRFQVTVSHTFGLFTCLASEVAAISGSVAACQAAALYSIHSEACSSSPPAPGAASERVVGKSVAHRQHALLLCSGGRQPNTFVAGAIVVCCSGFQHTAHVPCVNIKHNARPRVMHAAKPAGLQSVTG